MLEQEEISIQELAAKIKRIVGFEGAVKNDLSKPDGTPRKLMDISKLKTLGWERSISLEKGISNLYDWFAKFQKDQDFISLLICCSNSEANAIGIKDENCCDLQKVII